MVVDKAIDSRNVDTPDVSVVVATRGRSRMLKNLIDSIAGDPSLLEVVIVVDGKDPASVHELEALRSDRPWLSFCNPTHRGQLAALQVGVEHANGEIILLLDDDVLPGPMLASGHARMHRGRSDLVIMGSMPVHMDQKVHTPVGTRIYARDYQRHIERLERGETAVLEALWGGNLSVRRKDCLRVGLAATNFNRFYHSDRELGYRLAAAGLTGVYVPSLDAVHLHNRGATAFLRDARRQGSGRDLLAVMYPGHPNPGVPSDPPGRLGGILAQGVRSVGASPLAGPFALALMAGGSACGRLGRRDLELAAAKTARRLMLQRGVARSS